MPDERPEITITLEDGESHGRYVGKAAGIDAEGEITFTHRGQDLISADHTGAPDVLSREPWSEASTSTSSPSLSVGSMESPKTWMIERLVLFARDSRASQRSSKPKQVWAVSLSAIAPKPADALTLSTGANTILLENKS